MNILFIGGTGTISSAITRQLIKMGERPYLLNRGNANAEFEGKIEHIKVSDVNDEEELKNAIKPYNFDVVCDFIGFKKEQIERDVRVFNGKTSQFMYISSASAYNKPCKEYVITEGTTLANPYWQYSRDKIECEKYLMEQYQNEGFPATIIRPSHTYCEREVPLGVHGKNGSYQVIKRMLDGKKVIIHGDGTSLWTMTHNSDFAKGFIGLMGNPHAIGEAFQITNDETLTWNQIYETVARCLGVELKPVYVSSQFLAATSDYDYTGSLIGDKANSVVFDNSKLKKAVPGLDMNVRFEQGIKMTLDYILSHKECQKEDPEFDAYCDKVIDILDEAAKKIVLS